MEIYKDIKGYEGMYQVSNLGNVRSLSRDVKNYKGGVRLLKERILKPCLVGLKGNQYLAVKLFKNFKNKQFKNHKLVAMEFLSHRSKGYEGLIVDHKNGVKTDNRLENLQLITARENVSKDKKGLSKYTGVSWKKDRKEWRSQIFINGKNKHLGDFTDEIDAHNEYQKALKNHLKTL
tara:strand:- start:708 stop:1238 length:531 start_codon:yes stop_codon:yes gene_type:complete